MVNGTGGGVTCAAQADRGRDTVTATASAVQHATSRTWHVVRFSDDVQYLMHFSFAPRGRVVGTPPVGVRVCAGDDSLASRRPGVLLRGYYARPGPPDHHGSRPA